MTKKQLKVYLDVDNTIIKSSNYMASWYNEKYCHVSGWREAIGKDIYYFNGTDELPLITLDDINELFSGKEFWEKIEVYEDCTNTLSRLTDTGKYIFTFCSIGTSRNISNKTLFLEKEFPFVKQHELLVKNFGAETRMGKDKLVADGLLIDDHHDNLNGSALFEILFMGEGLKDWNKNFRIGRGKGVCTNWTDMYYLVEEIYDDWRNNYV